MVYKSGFQFGVHGRAQTTTIISVPNVLSSYNNHSLVPPIIYSIRLLLESRFHSHTFLISSWNDCWTDKKQEGKEWYPEQELQRSIGKCMIGPNLV